MIQTVIFDLDGVIIDSEPVHFQLEKQMFDELKIVVSFEEHCSFVGMSSQNMWDAIVGKHNLSYLPEELVEKKHTRYIAHLKNEDVPPVDGVIELIEQLHQNNFKLAVASSSHADVIDTVLKKFRLSDLFIASVSGTELTHSKPHPEIFLRAARIVDSEPGDCLVIEDAENGVVAAKAAGMKCIGFASPHSGIQNLDKADVVIQSFYEINVDRIRRLE